MRSMLNAECTGAQVNEDNMAEMGDGYGSECHLLRYLGRHRDRLDNTFAYFVGRAGNRSNQPRIYRIQLI